MDEPGIGHNSIAADQLKAFVERIERLEEEKAALAGDIREVYAEAKGNGFDTKILRKVIALRKKDAAQRREEEALLDLYLQALGMLADTPLGTAAIERNLGLMGKVVPLTDEERRAGAVVAFEGKDGTRSSISFGRDEQTDLEEAIAARA